MLDQLTTTRLLLAADDAASHGGDHGGGGHHGAEFSGLLVYIGLSVLILIVLMAKAKPGLNRRFFTNPITRLFEQLYFFIESLCVGLIGEHGRKYMPMVFTFWLMIFVGNVIALFMPTSPTADLSFNIGIALVAVMYVQWEGIRANGFFGHFKHFAGPSMGLALIPINMMIFVIELISEMMKNVSLSLRLYGNIDGGHRAVMEMNKLADDYYIPVGAFLLPVKILTCIVQALIFCLLFCVYLSLVTHHDHGDDHGDHGHEPTPAHA